VLATAEGIFMQVKGAERPPEKLLPYLDSWAERKASDHAHQEGDAAAESP
jgi:hypothetical protein